MQVGAAVPRRPDLHVLFGLQGPRCADVSQPAPRPACSPGDRTRS